MSCISVARRSKFAGEVAEVCKQTVFNASAGGAKKFLPDGIHRYCFSFDVFRIGAILRLSKRVLF